MRIIKFLLVAAFLLTAMPIANLAQSAVERFEPGREVQQVKKEGKLSKEKIAIPDTPDLITATAYPMSTSAGVALEDMSSGTTTLVGASTDDNNSVIANIGFNFLFDGVNFTQFGVNGNGFARLGGVPAGTSFTNGIATTTNAPKIMPFWDDLCVGSNGKVHSKTIGSAPNRKLIVEFQNMQITRGAGCAGTGGGTFQMWLFESTGVIQFVYGSGMIATAAVDGGYSIGLQSGAATNFASVTTATNTVSYAAANNTQTTAIAAGTSYTFTPTIPAAPSGINFTAVSATTMTVNWTDNATGELGYIVFRSTDGINFTQVASLPANSVSFNDSLLSPSTNYTYRIQAFSEGAFGPAATGSQTTSAPGNVSATGAGGLWSSTATWVGGVVPNSGDNVTIPTGATVTVDTAASALSVTVQSGATLTYDDTTARTLTIGFDLAINNGGVVTAPATGTVTTHVLSVGGNLTNNGTLDLSTNGNTAAVGLTFGPGLSNVTFGGTGAINDVRTITMNKGSQAVTVDLTQPSFTVQGVNTDIAGFLTLTSGTLKISGTFTMTNRVFATATYVIPLAGGIWLNNPNFVVSAQAGGTTCANNGLFRLSQGTYNIGVTGADGMGGGAGAIFTVDGGTINAVRIDPQNAVTWTQTGGTINLSAVANTRSNFGTFEIFSASSVVNVTGGTFNLIQATVAATPVDFRVNGLVNMAGSTLNVGNAATATNFNFRLSGNTPALNIDNTGNAKSVTFLAQTIIHGSASIPAGSTFAINGFLVVVRGSSLTNNGTITGNTTGSRLYLQSFTGPVVYSGSGIAGTVALPLLSVDCDAVGGCDFSGAVNNLITNRVILFTGDVTGAGKITLGINSATIVAVVQVGNTTTPTAAGVFDAPFNFAIGAAGQTCFYLRTTSSRTTGFEINPTNVLNGLQYDDNDPLHKLFIQSNGDDLTVTGTLTLTNGIIDTNNSLLIHNGTVSRTAGYVDGPMGRNFTVTGTYTYPFGQNGFSPMTASVTAVGSPTLLAAKAFDGTLAGFDPAHTISRSWEIREMGDVTASLSFTYLDADVVGNEADYRVFSRQATGGTNWCPGAPCVNTGTNVAGPATGVTAFSRWTVGEVQTPTAAFGSIRGRVHTFSNVDGQGIPNAKVTISGPTLPQPVTVYTNSFGFYFFPNLPVNTTYTVTVSHKKYTFSQNTRQVVVEDNVTTDADFEADPLP